MPPNSVTAEQFHDKVDDHSWEEEEEDYLPITLGDVMTMRYTRTYFQ